MAGFWVDQGVSATIGLAVGLIGPPVARRASRAYHRIRASTETHSPAFRPEDIGFFTLNQWSPNRRLQSSHVRVEFDDRPWKQDWCEPLILESLVANVENQGGPSSTLRAMEIDHRESDRGQHLWLTFAPSVYGDLLAVGQYFRDRPDRVKSLMERLAAEDVTSMIDAAPRSVVAINVTITSADDKLLAIRRSAAVTTSQNVWSLGPNETMLGASGASGGVETPHHMASRCLRGEVDLDEDDIEHLEISWIGYNVPGAMVHIVGHARSRLRSAEIEERLRQAHGAFELDDVRWLPATSRTVHGIVDGVQGSRPPRGDVDVRWLNSAGLAAADWWRWRRVIGQ